MSDGAAIHVRPAGESDLLEVLKLYAQPEVDDGDVLPLDEAQRLFRRFADYPDYTLFVADKDSAIVGSFGLLVMISLQHLGAPSGIVEDVVVAQDLHGQGIGKAMMRFAIALCRDKGCYKLMLSSNAKRERAHAFYEALGFERHGYSFRMVLKNPAESVA